MRNACLSVAATALVLSGCATKRYGRLQPMSAIEANAYDCDDLNLELAKVQSFEDQVADGADFNMKSVLGILGDWGIGNKMEKDSALKSARERRQQLETAKVQRGCDRQQANATTTAISTNPSDPAGTIDLGDGVKLRPAETLSGYCIMYSGPGTYAGTGAVNRPAVTSAKPLC